MLVWLNTWLEWLIGIFFLTRKRRHAALDALDLAPIRKLLQEKEGWSEEATLNGEREYRAFLALFIDWPGRRFSPSEEIDQFWHMHILDSQRYVPDSDAVFGRYLHHDPHLAVGTVGQVNAWENTKKYLHKKPEDFAPAPLTARPARDTVIRRPESPGRHCKET